MTKDDIIRMAQEVIEERGGSRMDDEDDLIAYSIQLAALVATKSAAKEREACAKVCEDIYNDPKGNDGYDCYYTRPYLECADAIRERSANARARETHDS